MRKIFLPLFLLLASCSIKWYPLKGHYPETPIIYHSDKSFDETWDKIIDLFSQQGFAISIMDKNSGFIASKKTGITSSYEDRKGKIIHPDAMVVLQRNNINQDMKLKNPNEGIRAEWNIHIKKDKTGTSVNINMVNIEIMVVGGSTHVEWVAAHGRTTGSLERIIYDAIK
jgi:hypothetical protein